MKLVDNFTDDSPWLEDTVAQLLRANGLHSYATQAYDEFTQDLGIEPSHITKNAYLSHFASYLQDYKKQDPAADEITDVMNSVSLRTTKI